MKKIYLTLVILGMVNISFAQIKSSGVVPLGSLMTVKFDLNNSTSMVTMTLTGPSDRWLAIGLDAIDMTTISDYVMWDSATTLGDYTATGGYDQPTPDFNDWTQTNTVVGSTRTIVATRSLAGGVGDYAFNYATISNLNLIWAYGPSFDISRRHSDRDIATATFSLLGVENFIALDKISIYPNPSNGIFSIIKNSAVEISKIRVYDTNAKLMKEVDAKAVNQDGAVNLSELSKGIYFMEISNETDKAVKKIIIH